MSDLYAERTRLAEKWAAVPQDRKDALEKYLQAFRDNPHGPTMR